MILSLVLESLPRLWYTLGVWFLSGFTPTGLKSFAPVALYFFNLDPDTLMPNLVCRTHDMGCTIGKRRDTWAWPRAMGRPPHGGRAIYNGRRNENQKVDITPLMNVSPP